MKEVQLMTVNVFVYGTLRRGQKYHELIAGKIKSMQNATARGILYDLPCGYPAMISGEGAVCGELFELDDAEEALTVLDELEDYHGPGKVNEYERVQITVVAEDGTAKSCYAYVYPEERRAWLEKNGMRVSSGDWIRPRS